jgi:hypothetical protein
MNGSMYYKINPQGSTLKINDSKENSNTTVKQKIPHC